MKKFYCLLLCVFLLLLSACSLTETDNSSDAITGESISDENSLIAACDYYKLYANTLSETYEIYNANGELVRTEATDMPLSVTMLNETTVDISKGKGTGITQHTYYSVQKDAFSDDFLYVICADNDLIAYIGLAEDGSDDKTLIVQNIFDKSSYCKEFKGVFDQVDTYDLSSVEGEFSNDLSILTVRYYQNEQQYQISKNFRL